MTRREIKQYHLTYQLYHQGKPICAWN